MSLGKTAGGCALGIAAAPFVALAYAASRVYLSGAAVIAKHPRTSVLALASGLLWYQCSSVEHSERLLRRGLEKGTALASHYSGRQERTLEQQIAFVAQQNQGLAGSLSRQQEYIAQLEERLAHPPAPKPPATPQPTQQRLVPRPMLEHPDYNFYFVDIGDTLAGIAERITGSSANSRILAADNSIADPRTLMTGQILKVKKSLTYHNDEGLYRTVASLKSLILPGNVSVSEQFGTRASEVMRLNEELGITCPDKFPYAQGLRVVYYVDAGQ